MSQDTVLLEALALRLSRLGMVVVQHGTHIAVRGVLLSSVRVRITDGVLHCDPYIAYLPRTRATLARNFGLGILAVGAIVGQRAGSEAPLIAFVALSSWGFDALCYVVTESAIQQIRQSFVALIEPSASDPARLGAPPMATFPVTRPVDEVDAVVARRK